MLTPQLKTLLQAALKDQQHALGSPLPLVYDPTLQSHSHGVEVWRFNNLPEVLVAVRTRSTPGLHWNLKDSTVYDNLDWQELAVQKNTLLQLRDLVEQNPQNFPPDTANHLSGVIHLLDRLQDTASTSGFEVS